MTKLNMYLSNYKEEEFSHSEYKTLLEEVFHEETIEADIYYIQALEAIDKGNYVDGFYPIPRITKDFLDSDCSLEARNGVFSRLHNKGNRYIIYRVAGVDKETRKRKEMPETDYWSRFHQIEDAYILKYSLNIHSYPRKTDYVEDQLMLKRLERMISISPKQLSKNLRPRFSFSLFDLNEEKAINITGGNTRTLPVYETYLVSNY